MSVCDESVSPEVFQAGLGLLSAGISGQSNHVWVFPTDKGRCWRDLVFHWWKLEVFGSFVLLPQ